jgi:hypothetical protein
VDAVEDVLSVPVSSVASDSSFTADCRASSATVIVLAVAVSTAAVLPVSDVLSACAVSAALPCPNSSYEGRP